MLSNGNGNGWAKWTIRILIGALILAISSILNFHANRIEAVEQDARIERKELRERIDIGIEDQNEAMLEQTKQMGDMDKKIGVVQNDVSWIKDNLKKALNGG